MASENIQVAVRVRPFNDREKDLGARCCIDMNGVSTILKDLDEGKPDRLFTFSYSFWSHDGYKLDDEGRCLPDSEKYADQKQVFELLGKSVLENAWGGFHCCLFAYGQTGAGKSYSMIGFGKNHGIVPMACYEIFERIRQNTDKSVSYEVMVSMMEIYNEQVQDLLVHPSKRPKGGLEIHENKQMGVYVEGITKRAVEKYEAIEDAMSEGVSNRTIGSTLMNATSSRAHTVITIEFREMSLSKNSSGQKVGKVKKFSVINLVDLAGSEKSSQTGATGDRLKEGCAINKSLSALGNVISALADRSSGKTSAVIPYRDSKLTRLLSTALGGNSKTIMICAISPASSNYEETLSTLRYAERAKNIKNVAIVNEDPTEKLIKNLRDENERLRMSVMSGSLSEETAATVRALEAQLAESQKTWEQRLKDAESIAQASRASIANLALPHMANLNEDPLLTGKIIYSFKEDAVKTIGKASTGDKEPPGVVLAGLGCFEDHAMVSVVSGSATLTCKHPVFVNGARLSDGQTVKLNHSDRLIFGQNHCFVFIYPNIGSLESLVLTGEVSYSTAKKELAEMQGERGDLSSDDIQKRLAEAESARRKLEQEAQAAKSQLQRLSDSQSENEEIAIMKEKMKIAEQKLFEAEKRQKELLESHPKSASLLDEKLMSALPLCKEANLIAKELGKPYELKVKLHVIDASKRKKEIVVAVEFNGKHVYDWSIETLENRVFLMREMFEKWCDDPSSISTVSEEQDPFWDPIQQERFLGSARILLESLTMQLENEVDAKILSTEGKFIGTLHCEVWPLAKDGVSTQIPDNEIVEESKHLIGHPMNFLVKVTRASGMAVTEEVRIEFRFYLDEQVYQIPASKIVDGGIVWNYEKKIQIDAVTDRLLTYLKEEAITFNLHTHQSSIPKVEPTSPMSTAKPERSSSPVKPEKSSSPAKLITPVPVKEKKSRICTVM